MPQYNSWTLFSLGLLLAVIGTFALTLLLYYWEQSIGGIKKESPLYSQEDRQFALNDAGDKVTSLNPMNLEPFSSSAEDGHHEKEESEKKLNLLESSLKSNQEFQEQLAKQLELKTQEFELQSEENKQLELKALQIAQDFADYKLFSEEQLKQKQLQLASLQQMIEDQRTEWKKDRIKSINSIRKSTI